jgi:hypothetical protein
MCASMRLVPPRYENFALSKLGGPNVQRAMREAQYYSVGIPRKFVSSFPFEFSS